MVMLLIPKENKEEVSIAAETIILVNPNSEAEKMFGKSKTVLTAPIITPIYDVIKFKMLCFETTPITLRI